MDELFIKRLRQRPAVDSIAYSASRALVPAPGAPVPGARYLAQGTATPNDFTTHRGLLMAFLELAAQATCTGDVKPTTLWLLDEFGFVKNLPSLETLLTFSAGYGLRLLLVAQSLSQLGQAQHLILGNCYDQLYFAARDHETAKHLSERLGTRTIKTRSRTRGQGRTSHTSNQAGRPLRLP